jgi:hypothetical protein
MATQEERTTGERRTAEPQDHDALEPLDHDEVHSNRKVKVTRDSPLTYHFVGSNLTGVSVTIDTDGGITIGSK